MAFALNIGKCSLLGNYRENNEDSVDVKMFPDLTVSIVADGMGGQAAGEIASKRAVEAKDHRLRNVLWKYLGSKEVGEGPEVAVVQIQPGDRFLLCTDGLTGVVPDDQLAGVLSSATDMQQCAEALGQLALDQGSRDNVTCVVFEVVEGQG